MATRQPALRRARCKGVCARAAGVGLLGALLWRTPLAAQSTQGAPPSTAALTGAGVSAALATWRGEQLRNVRYALSLDVTGSDSASGRVVMTFDVQRAGDVVVDFRGRSLRDLVVNGTAVPGTSWNRAHVVLPASLLRATNNRVEMAFTTPVAAAGASIIRTRDVTDGRDYLYTLLVPSDAHLLFPCFDQPDLKARLTLSVTTPPAWHALGNGVLTARDSTAASITHRFAETKPLSTYLMAFAAGPWSRLTRDAVISTGAPPVPMSVWARTSRAAEVETDTLVAMNARALRWLGDWFGVPYPFDNYSLLLAPAFPFGGMEHPGAVFYNEESFIYRERPTASQLLGRQATTFHEVAHQWFGDYVTMQWFDDLWLKEGFATYMAARMQSELGNADDAWKTFYLRNKPVAYGTDATAGTTPVWQQLGNLDQAKSNYGPIVYNKAPGILRQLEFLVGAKAFQRGVRAFLATHAYGNATWQSLLQHIGTAAGRDLTPWGRQWILRPGMPIVEQQLTVRDGRIVRLALVQRPAQPAVSGAGAWPLKVQVQLFYDGGRPAVMLPVELRADTTVVESAVGRAAPQFVFANAGDYGYALVLPDSASVRWLEQRIGTVTRDLDRAMLWGSLWDLVREARWAPARFAEAALRELPRERDEQIAGALVGRLSTVLTRYASSAEAAALRPRAEALLLTGAADTTRSYGQRKTQLDAAIGLATDAAALRRLDGWLNADSVAGLPLRAPTRWAIVTRLMAQQAPGAEARLVAESRRDSTTEGRRLAFVAATARPDSAGKAALFDRWFGDATLNEEWVTSSLRAFHEPGQAALTARYLVPALDTLPWIQQNRRIFFLGSWLGATIGGQSSAASLATIDAWLAGHPATPADLRQKILQARDELERTVRIRRRFGEADSALR